MAHHTDTKEVKLSTGLVVDDTYQSTNTIYHESKNYYEEIVFINKLVPTTGYPIKISTNIRPIDPSKPMKLDSDQINNKTVSTPNKANVVAQLPHKDSPKIVDPKHLDETPIIFNNIEQPKFKKDVVLHSSAVSRPQDEDGLDDETPSHEKDRSYEILYRAHLGIKAVVAYIRVSTKHKSQNSSYENQIHYINNYADYVCLPVRAIYKERVSGAEYKKQKQLLNLIQHLQNGDLIVVSNLSRFSRDSDNIHELFDLVVGKGACLKALDVPRILSIDMHKVGDRPTDEEKRKVEEITRIKYGGKTAGK